MWPNWLPKTSPITKILAKRPEMVRKKNPSTEMGNQNELDTKWGTISENGERDNQSTPGEIDAFPLDQEVEEPTSNTAETQPKCNPKAAESSYPEATVGARSCY